MFSQIFSFSFVLLVYFFLNSDSQVKGKEETKNEHGKYQSPGTVSYPLGDEELNNNLFETGGINEALETHDTLQDFKARCTDLPISNEYQNPHVCCESDNIAEVIFTSDSTEVVPSVQCRKCDLRVTSDGKAVVVRCFECLDIPIKDNHDREIVYLVYYLEIANYTTNS